MFATLRFGRPGAPTWMTALQLAEAWHVPPWEIMDAPGSLRWAARYAAYHEVVRKVQEQSERTRRSLQEHR